MSGLFMRILVLQECQYFIRKRFDLADRRGRPIPQLVDNAAKERLTGG